MNIKRKKNKKFELKKTVINFKTIVPTEIKSIPSCAGKTNHL